MSTTPPLIENVTYDELAIGQSARLVRVLTQADIQAFALVSGDVNPAHVDPAYAAFCTRNPLRRGQVAGRDYVWVDGRGRELLPPGPA